MTPCHDLNDCLGTSNLEKNESKVKIVTCCCDWRGMFGGDSGFGR